MLYRTEPHVAVDKPSEHDRADRLGTICLGDIRRALFARYEHEPYEVREWHLTRDLHCAVALAQHAWCSALNATGYRETPCGCLVGGHR